MRLTPLVVAVVLVANCATAGVVPQTERGAAPMRFRTLTEDTPQAAVVNDRIRELTIRWTAASPANPEGGQPATAASMVVMADQSLTGSVRRQRQPQVTEDQLVVVQRRADGRAVDWVLIPNPRVIRAEMPGADGRLTGRTILRAEADLLITVPHVPSAVSLSVHQPRWTGTEYLLDLVGEVALPRTR